MKVLNLEHVDIKMVEDGPIYTADAEPCFFCGRPVKNLKTAGEVEIIWGGGVALLDREGYDEESDAGYMGWYSVGPDCYKKFQKAAKEHAEIV